MARRKEAAIYVPQSDASAVVLVTEYVQFERAATEVRLAAELAIDGIKTRRDREVAILSQNQAARFASLKAWWEAGGKDRAGKKRSAEIGGATLGIRLTPPAVKLARGLKVEALVDWLGRVVGGAGYLRTKIELDKPAVIKAIQEGAPIREPMIERGVSVIQTDEFFIDCGLDEGALRAELAGNATTKE